MNSRIISDFVQRTLLMLWAGCLGCTLSSSQNTVLPKVNEISVQSRDLLDGAELDIYLPASWLRLQHNSSGLSAAPHFTQWHQPLSRESIGLREAAEVSLLHTLRTQRGVRLFLSPPAERRANGVQFNVNVVSYTEDIDEAKRRGEIPHHTVGTIISTVTPLLSVSAGAVAGPVGGFIIGFDALTGIPLSGDSWRKTGAVTLEISASDLKTGRVLLTKSVTGQFLSQFNAIGHDLDLTNGYREFARSVPTEAIQAALNAELPGMLAKLRARRSDSDSEL